MNFIPADLYVPFVKELISGYKVWPRTRFIRCQRRLSNESKLDTMRWNLLLNSYTSGWRR